MTVFVPESREDFGSNLEDAILALQKLGIDEGSDALRDERFAGKVLVASTINTTSRSAGLTSKAFVGKFDIGKNGGPESLHRLLEQSPWFVGEVQSVDDLHSRGMTLYQNLACQTVWNDHAPVILLRRFFAHHDSSGNKYVSKADIEELGLDPSDLDTMTMEGTTFYALPTVSIPELWHYNPGNLNSRRYLSLVEDPDLSSEAPRKARYSGTELINAVEARIAHNAAMGEPTPLTMTDEMVFGPLASSE